MNRLAVNMDATRVREEACGDVCHRQQLGGHAMAASARHIRTKRDEEE
jgi:hypothetical protein